MAGIRDLFATLFNVIKSGPAPKPPGVPTPGPLPKDIPTPVNKDAVLPPLNGRILKRGPKKDSLVEALQKRLIEIGFHDLNPDGEFGEVTDAAVRQFQRNRNLDPDGEVGDMSWAQLARADAGQVLPPLLPPSTEKYGEAPPWYVEGVKDIGFHEIGDNRGLDKFITQNGGVGQNGDPWCAIWINAKVHVSGLPTSGSAMARSFEHHKNFVKLSGPALGAITTMWRDSPSAGIGHVFLYDGESSAGVRGIGGNESDEVKRSFHTRARIVGYYWPASAPLPKTGAILVNASGTPINTKET